MPLPIITPLPTPPSRTDAPSAFNTQADALMAALPDLVDEINTFGAAVSAEATATNYNATSSTSMAVGTGSKSFTASTGKNFSVGQFVIIANTTTPANYMLGQVTAYNSSTGAMTVNVTSTGGSGTLAAWTISLGTTGGALLNTGDQGATGALRIGSTSAPTTGYNFQIDKNMTGATGTAGARIESAIQSDVTVSARIFQSIPSTAAAAFTLTDLFHHTAEQGTFGAGSTVTNQTGFIVASNLTGATNNYGFVSQIASGSNRWNLYMGGTADNYIAGNFLIGTTTAGGYKFRVTTSASGSTVGALQNTNAAGFSGLHVLDNSGSTMGHFGYANASASGGAADTVYLGSIANKAVSITTNDAVRVVIEASGEVKVNTPTVGSGKMMVKAGSGYAYSASDGADFTALQVVHGAGQVGAITATSTTTTYATTSDKTFKVDDGILSAADAWVVLRLAEIHNFRWTLNDDADIGAFAQDLYLVYPRAVQRGGWRDPETGEFSDTAIEGVIYTPWGVDYSKLVPLLVTAMQDVDARLTALEAA